jgi:hypothetical protein
MDQPPYSPDLGPCDFRLFALKNALKGQRFADIPNFQCSVTLLQGILKTIFKTVSSSGTTVS